VAAQLKPAGGRSRLLSRRSRAGTDAAVHRHAVPRTDVTVLDQRQPLRLAHGRLVAGKGRVSDDPSSPATGSESSTTSASGGGASGSSRERSSGCSSSVDPDSPDVGRRDRTGSGPYGRSADEGVCPASLGGVEGCMASLSGIKYVVFGRIVGRGGTRHGRVGAFDGRDGVATWSRRCLGDVPARRSSTFSLSAGDSRGLQAGGTRAPSCCGAVALSPSSTRRQLAPRFRRSLHPAQGSCWRSQPRCCVVGSFDRVTGVADRRELPELEDRGVGRSRGRLGG
jgi:hypothetical protein